MGEGEGRKRRREGEGKIIPRFPTGPRGVPLQSAMIEGKSQSLGYQAHAVQWICLPLITISKKRDKDGEEGGGEEVEGDEEKSDVVMGR